MRLSALALTLLVAGSTVACGSRSFGNSGDDGGSPPTDSAVVLPDAWIPTADVYGYIRIIAQSSPQGSPLESLSLSAAYYGEPWDMAAPGAGWPEPQPLVTPDGVACDFVYRSGMDGPIPPEPPAELDGGRIDVWAGWDGDDSLWVYWLGDSYSFEHRPGNQDMPLWATPEAIALQVESAGSAQADPFHTEVFLAATPEILAPPESNDEPLTPDPDGTHTIAWSPVSADRVEVLFHFNMDWDDTWFRCYPEPGRTDLKMDHDWFEQHTWGYGELTVTALYEQAVEEGSTAVLVRTLRSRELGLNIALTP